MEAAKCRALWAIAALALAVGLGLHPEAQIPVGLPDAAVITSLPAPEAIRGLTFANRRLWSIDARKDVLLEIDAANGTVLSAQAIDVKRARGLAWDGHSFWCGNDDGRLIQVDAKSGRVLKSYDRRPFSGAINVADVPFTLQGLAWDGKSLWAAYDGLNAQRAPVFGQPDEGYNLVRVDVSDGHDAVNASVQQIPLGLASDGKSLWMATYDAGRGRALLVRWTIPDRYSTVNAPSRVMGRTGLAIARLPGKEPAGLAWDGSALWYADRQQKQFMKLALP
jgi:hypothetical protein